MTFKITKLRIFAYTCSKAETNTRFAWIFGRLHNFSNTMKAFEYTANDFGLVILAYLVNIYIRI